MNLDPRTGGWRPIATAPRDGTTIWVMHEDVGAFVMRWGEWPAIPARPAHAKFWAPRIVAPMRFASDDPKRHIEHWLREGRYWPAP